MKCLSLFAGVGGFDLGFERAGIKTIAFSETNSHCVKLFQKHFPSAKWLNDVQKIDGKQFKSVDVICGGFPCQDVSLAGKRAGLAGSRSGLFWQFHRIIDEARPRIFIMENVPGLLHINEGKDFESIVWALDELGYGFAWSVLDSQFFGVPQRRRRLFIVGCFGANGCTKASKILAIREGLEGDNPPPRKKREAIAGNPGKCNEVANTISTKSRLDASHETYVMETASIHEGWRGTKLLEETSTTLVAGGGKPGQGYPAIISIQEGGHGISLTDELGTTVMASGSKPGFGYSAIIQALNEMNTNESQSKRIYTDDGVAVTLNSEGGGMGAKTGLYFTGNVVRRLTPLECERLQGFPDNWTEGFKDGTRYKMLGNAVTVNVAEYLGRQIMAYG